ncbi:hypothetical protein GUJ93_ZPchr0013g36629 [Zizania palustris]|uniref:Uncharacterized protein n=1 Tax=Zizania palustris TaxID=103762 RepID=A0A8J5X3C2_ZIZPA|nr:hypothetical protein GUJ93_ZPchr0013g36629 [Zizania palustris]
MGSQPHGSHGQSSDGQQFGTPAGSGSLRLGGCRLWLAPCALRAVSCGSTTLCTSVAVPLQLRLRAGLRRSAAPLLRAPASRSPAFRLRCRRAAVRRAVAPAPSPNGRLGDSRLPPIGSPVSRSVEAPDLRPSVLAARRLTAAPPRTPVSACNACCGCGFEKSLTRLAS